MSGEIIRGLTGSDKPLCPNGFMQPVHPSHAIRVRMLDAYYDATPRNEDGEMPEPLDKAYSAAAYGVATADRMSLYVDTASFLHQGQFVTVESFYYRCGICGLILPAQRRETTRP